MATVLDKTPKLFGAYVVSVSTSLSWGSQGASTQFTLVEDPKNKDENGEPDPVIINIPPMGTPILFPNYEIELVTNPNYDEVDNPNVPIVIEKFVLDQNGDKIKQEFGPFTPDKPLASGFLQRATYSQRLSGWTHDIVIQSPATILDGVQVVLNNFNGTGLGGTLTNEVVNLLNVFGHYENFLVGGNNPFTGNWIRGGFGDSAVNDQGFPLGSYNQDNLVVNMFDTIVQMTYDPYYSVFGNPIRHGNYAYELDFSEAIRQPDGTYGPLGDLIQQRNLWDYRISGDVRDLSSIISEVCDLLQFDWMVELRSPRDNSLTGNLRLCIKMIDRSSVPTPNVVKEFIANTGDEENAAYGSLISCSYGQELSSATTAKVVLGAPVSRYLDREIADCVPMFGRGSGEGTWQMGPVWSNNPLSGGLYNPAKAGKFIRANELYTNANLYDPYFWFTVVVPGYGQYNVTLMELRMLTGQQPRRAWSHFKVFQTLAGREPNGGKATELRYQPWFADIRISQKDFDLIINNQVPAMTAQQTSYNQNDKRRQQKNKAKFNLFFEGLIKIANSFCNHFMAQVPLDLEDFETYGLTTQEIIKENIKFINTYGDLEAEQYKTSWSIASDAWALDPQVGRSDFFNNGRLKSMAGFKKLIQYGDWGGPSAGGDERGVNIRDMGDNWTYSRVFSQQQQNPNIVPWDAFHGGGPSPMRMPRYNPQTNKFQQVVYNPWGRGIGQQTMLGVSANILSLDGGTMEEEIYLIPEAGLPKDQAASWVPCQAGANPLIFDELTHPQAGFVVLAKYFFNKDIDPGKIGLALSNAQLYDISLKTAQAQAPVADFDSFKGEQKRKKYDAYHFEIPPLRALPIGFGVAQQSNKYRYGPWTKVNAPNYYIPNPDYDSEDENSSEEILSYISGKTAVEFDDDLSPETFGGFGGLNQAGFMSTEIGMGRVAVDETGYIEIVGLPEYNLGDRFRDAGPFVTDLDIAVGTDGVKHTYKFNTWTPKRGKLAKYNVSVLERVGKSSFKNLLGAQDTTSRMPIAGGIGVFGVDPRLARTDTFRNSTFSFNPNEFGDISPPHMIGAHVWKANTTTVGTTNLQASASPSTAGFSTASSSIASADTGSSSSNVAADTSDEVTIVASTDDGSSTSSYS